ncbi:MAG: tRNA (uridine(54)-C5)-methyltransferase TrmA [Cellvibrionales bacterium]|nr:tRNA (uridine(54)-C5)-methyltransferase TrmA [Cellvibrionales bacterium]
MSDNAPPSLRPLVAANRHRSELENPTPPPPDPKHSLAAKARQLRILLAPFTDLAAALYPSPPHGYRMRIERRIWQGHYAVYEAGSKRLRPVNNCALAAAPIRALMPRLLAQINKSDVLQKRLFRADFLATTTGEILVSLIYHCPLDKTWQAAAEALRQNLSINLIGRARKQKIVLGADYVTERLAANNRHYQLRQIEGSFTQPNAMVNEKMVAWACKQADKCGGDMLELYCGNGNFTLPLAAHFNQVLATEVSKASITALRWNKKANAVKNIALARLSAAETAAALARTRPFRRLRDIDLDRYHFSSLFVDPPRAGLDSHTVQFAAQFDRIFYFSCNPASLAANIAQLAVSHRIQALAAFDQFPNTPHLEAGVVLERRRC